MDQQVSRLDREVHTLEHRVTVLESRTSGLPERVALVESAVSRLPEIERSLAIQGQQIQRGFNLTNGILLGAGAVWMVFQAGPEILKLLGGR